MNVLGSFAKKVGTVAIVYLLGYFQFSVAWLIGPVIFSVIRDEWKKEKELKRTIAKAAAMCNEKEVILARVDDLPSWVFFPDVERAEWINKILRQVWPNVNHYAKNLIKDTIEPAVAESLASYKLNGFQFQKMLLGSIPPRIGGVKVYDKNVSRNEILMDLDVFYAGDCDISFSLAGVTGSGIKDFQIHGMVRVVMKPLITTMPMVGGLQIFFLNNPNIDFNLVGVADVLDMPGLSDLLRRIIVEQVANMMVLPNKLPIRLSDEVPSNTLKLPEPEGVLRVHVVEAKDLMKKDIGMLGKGKSDPYAIITVGAQTFKTKIIDNTVNPKWDYWCEFKVEDINGQKIDVILRDHDNTGKDENLGRATLEINRVAKRGHLDTWITLEQAKHGIVHLRMTWFKLSSNIEDLKEALAETQTLRVTSMSSALLTIFVDSVKNLPNARIQSKPDPYVTITLCKSTKSTKAQWRTDNPVFEQDFNMIHNPEVDTMHLKVTDNKTGKEIGELVYNLSQLLEKPKLKVDHQPFHLKKSGGETKIFLSMHLKILKFQLPLKKEPSFDESTGVEGEEMESSSPNESSSVDSYLKKQDSIKKRQGSIKSNKSDEMIMPSDPLPVGSNSSDLLESEGDFIVTGSSSKNFPSRTDSVRSNRSGISNVSEKGEHGLGKILLTMSYSMSRQRFDVTVHRISGLPMNDPTNIPDPYVKLYLLPERNKDSKRKTEAIKDNCNPVYEQQFEYIISPGELSNRQLEVSVATRKKLFSSSSNCMGQVLINLNELNLSETTTEWFDLMPEFHKDKDD
ncbi:conserved hypothetical protein [Pediculus humanus corporis]|uniref:Extended synaptotagmin-2 n=1 Tax=Pediculus humanus subsp. corporis TaxID=121224 RepID=E0VZ51_PEDHC|nr:uncharacterized protein Phum_PHUM524840 [Pediculus humanus corporis]EEB18657.1 conserved hypothetical protein [Pediculus humanus corporis]